MIVKDELISQIDNLLKSGDINNARLALEEITVSKVPERLSLKLSDLFIRCGLPKDAVKVLYPILFETNDISEREKYLPTYALALQQMGAYNEAFKTFEKIDFNKNIQANLYYAVALFSKWDYAGAIPYLENYLKDGDITPYQKLVGQTNLAQAFLITGAIEKAEAELNTLLETTKKNKYYLLYANALEIKSQMLLVQKKYGEVNEILKEAISMLSEFPSRYKLLTDLWAAIAELGTNPTSKSAMTQFTNLRRDAVGQQRWPIVRECDFYLAIVENDNDLFLKVYFGTPFPQYRERLKFLFGKPVEMPGAYRWKGIEKTVPEEKTLKVLEGVDTYTGAKLKRAQVPHKLLQALTSDFYVNFRVETLFSILFPEENYNPMSSDNRIHQAVKRLQTWFDENEIPIDIRFKNDGYRFFFVEPYAVEVQLGYDQAINLDIGQEILKFLEKNEAATARELSQKLKIPVRTMYRKIDELLNDNTITTQRVGREVKYRLVK